MNIERFRSYGKRVSDNCGKVILGKEDAILLILTSFICGGNILLEDLPGTGKTMLLRAFAASIGGSFKRIQFTPDLLPSDLTGVNFFNRKTNEFEFRAGPLFANIVLADEINRASPRTQSSLLEAMEEKQISVDGVSYALSEPYMVMATQNPIETYGTFPLPEAQLDRFFMRLSLGYMTREQEAEVISRPSSKSILLELSPVVSEEETYYVRAHYHEVHVSKPVQGYILDIVEKTRRDKSIAMGVSTRGGIALYQASQALAALKGRDFVIPEDVLSVAPPILCHRINPMGGLKSGNALAQTEKLLASIPVPLERV